MAGAVIRLATAAAGSLDSRMEDQLALIGFGEAGSTFANAAGWGRRARVYDLKSDLPAERDAMLASYAATGVTPCANTAEAAQNADILLSLVTADQALAAAREATKHLAEAALYCDMNSVAPDTKRAAAMLIDNTGGRYVDVAVMAPVDPSGMAVPLLLSGPAAAEARDRLAVLGFTNLEVVGSAVGDASSIKLIRSVMVKGIEALTAECMLAAEAAGVRDRVLASLDASERARPWRDRAEYNLGRMIVHGMRRAAEMAEAVTMLDALGVCSAMTRATVETQRRIGAIGAEPGAGLEAKIARINGARAQAA